MTLPELLGKKLNWNQFQKDPFDTLLLTIQLTQGQTLWTEKRTFRRAMISREKIKNWKNNLFNKSANLNLKN